MVSERTAEVFDGTKIFVTLFIYLDAACELQFHWCHHLACVWLAFRSGACQLEVHFKGLE